jgi:hypothetical protein
MLAHGHRIFSPTSRIRKLERLDKALKGRTERQHLAAHRFFSTLDPAVVDAFRITCCFENLFKARLILGGWLIHRFDKRVQPEWWALQSDEPIRVSALKRVEGHVGKRDIGYEFQSLSDKTLQWSTLVGKPAYRSATGLPDRLFQALLPFSTKRNTLHFLALDSAQYSQALVDDLRVIRSCFNRFVVEGHNRLMRHLGVPDTHFKAEI